MESRHALAEISIWIGVVVGRAKEADVLASIVSGILKNGSEGTQSSVKRLLRQDGILGTSDACRITLILAGGWVHRSVLSTLAMAVHVRGIGHDHVGGAAEGHGRLSLAFVLMRRNIERLGMLREGVG